MQRARGLEMRSDLGAVAVGAGRGDDGGDVEGDAGHVLEEFGDLLAFPVTLLGVVEMLILAAAAAAEERAAGIDAVGGRREGGDEVGFGEILVVAEDAGADAFARERERDHHNPAGRGVVRQRDATEAGAEVGERGDLEFDFLVIRERLVVEFLLFLNHETHEIHERDVNEPVFWRVFRRFRGLLLRT